MTSRDTGTSWVKWPLVAVTVVVVGVLAGCVMEPPLEDVQVRNDSGLTLGLTYGDDVSVIRDVMDPGASGILGISGDARGCEDVTMTVWTMEGVLVATLGPPVCDDDLWVITQADVDAAAAGKPGTPAPTPTG